MFFTYSLVLTTFYHVAAGAVGYYLIAFAAGNLLGRMVLGRLFDVVGRRAMIASTYLASGVMLAVTAWLFDRGALTATTQTLAWVVIFFVASAGASSAYLTVSEIFPMETRALAIAFFYAVGTGIGGIIGPVLFGALIATKRPFDVAIGYLIGGVLMAAAGLVEVFLGVDAEQQSLEDIAAPLSAPDQPGEDQAGEDHSGGRAAVPISAHAPLHPRPRTSTGRAAWAPRQQVSIHPFTDPYLEREVETIVDALDRHSPQSPLGLSRSVGARFWGPGPVPRRVAVGARCRAHSPGGQEPSGLPSSARRRRPFCRTIGHRCSIVHVGGSTVIRPYLQPRPPFEPPGRARHRLRRATPARAGLPTCG